jgi:CubicO group peptidase (beta-lactamase class C family)
MHFLRSVVLGVVTLAATTPSPAQNEPAPCAAAEHRAFDFWLGEWNVYTANGKLAGTNSIKKEMGGCILHERYETGRGYSGESFNVYDAPRKVWHQTWVDSRGLLLLLEGGIRDGKMVLEGQTTASDQTITKHRITWTPSPDGTVRQLWESTDLAGQWIVAFDGKYVRK